MSSTLRGRSTLLRRFSSRLIASAPAFVIGMLSAATALPRIPRENEMRPPPRGPPQEIEHGKARRHRQRETASGLDPRPRGPAKGPRRPTGAGPRWLSISLAFPVVLHNYAAPCRGR